ncbi:MAG: uroporphyrinogen-III C-methyltransferase [Bacteroidota bacterium]
MVGKLILIGAGPGDEELITLKGVRALESADVVLYDALANPLLLQYCGRDCEQIFVGKRAGLHFMDQDSINELIVQKALEGKTVARLKGGDPFVFGRGYEEMTYAGQHGIDSVLIPGISSSMAVPATCGIPVTCRGITESFWVVTGTTKTGTFSKDMMLAAQSSATVVILMGMKNIEKIVAQFCHHRGRDEAAAVIMNGTSSNERAAYGTLADIAQKARYQNISSPAIIVIGEVVNARIVKMASIQAKGNIITPMVMNASS